MIEKTIDRLTVESADGAKELAIICDSEARGQLAVFAEQHYPIGIELRSKAPLDPHLYYGGIWEYDETNHGLNGEYIYTKIANSAEELEGEEAA